MTRSYAIGTLVLPRYHAPTDFVSTFATSDAYASLLCRLAVVNLAIEVLPACEVSLNDNSLSAPVGTAQSYQIDSGETE